MKQSKNTPPRESTIPHGTLLWRFLRGSKGWFSLSVLTALVMAVADTVNPQLVRYTVDTVIGGKPSELPAFADRWAVALGGPAMFRQNLWIIAAAVGIVGLVAGLSRYLQRVWNTTASETLTRRMRHMLFTHIQRLPYAWQRKNRTGDLIQRCTSDVDTVTRFVSEQLTAVLRVSIQLTVSLWMMYGMNVKLAAVATVTLPVIFVYSVFFRRKLSRGFRACDEGEGILSAMAQENLTGVRVVRAFGRENYERERFRKQNKEYTNLWLKVGRWMASFWATGDLITGLQVMLVLVLGVVLCVRGEMTAGSFIAFMSYNSMLIWPIRRLGRVVSEMSKAGIAIDRLGYILSAPVEEDKPGAVEPPMDGDIVFDNINFGYEGCPQLLHDVSFTVKAGGTVGILGGTGSGKTTLIHLLNRLYPLPADGSGGRITVGGVDVADIKAAHLRRNIGMVLQEPYLFSRSIADNIGITREDPAIGDIREAAQVACLDDAVMAFAQGYDTFVGERGVTLSGGQKQRAAIARMLTQKAPIMVLDDSLSAVDAETDAKIRAALRERMQGSTVFLISHRTATLMQADLILVMDRGRVAERGTHEELMAIDGGIYRRIYEMQTGMDGTETEATV